MRWIALLALVTLVGCGGNEASNDGSSEATMGSPPPASAEDVGVVVAKVGDTRIGSNDLELSAARRAPANGQTFTAEEKRDVLDGLITEEVLYQEAFRRGLYRDPKVRKIMINLLLRDEVYSTVRNSDFTQDELREYFESHKEEFVVPEKIQVKRILIKVGDERDDATAKALATDLSQQVQADPGKFRDLASEHSEDPYKRRGGDLGYVSKEGKPGVAPEVIEKAFTLDVGQVSEPFLAGGGYNVVFVANRRERVERTFEQMKGSVLRTLKNERYKDLTDAYVEKVKDNYTIDVKDAALEGVELESSRRMSLGPSLERRMGREGPDLRRRFDRKQKDDEDEEEE